MQLTVTSGTGIVFTVDVGEEMELENLLALCQIEVPDWATVPLQQFVLVHNGVTYNRDGEMLKRTMKELSIAENDMVLVDLRPPARANAPPTGSTPAPNAFNSMLAGLVSSIRVPQKSSPGGSNATRRDDVADVTRLFQRVKNDSRARAQLEHSNPPLFDAVARDDFGVVFSPGFNRAIPETFRRVLASQMTEHAERSRARLHALTADPSDAAAQRYIEEQIEQENIRHQLETAMEHMPESFATVHMLYIPCQINQYPVKAFVDSGAQRTIMSQQCAERCSVMRLVDKRFQGVAAGVGGSQKILGRIHMVQVQIEKEYLAMSFDVLKDQTMDVLLGLDMLKRHQCLIDLKTNQLHIGDHTVIAFLPESELPAHARLNTNVEHEDVASEIVIDPDAIRQLVAMGFAEQAAREALVATFGDVGAAAARLTDQRDLPQP